ncbi:zinc ribbon domain-containing protein [Streptomyces virginiae]|uniref:zinc ribbon domain-containing protein n=1 Tax=Streptomyces virginiae TaxID=1961 RepID=UPI00099D129F
MLVKVFQKPEGIVSRGEDPRLGLGGVLAQADRSAVAEPPILIDQLVEQVRRVCAGWSSFVTVLEYRAARYGRTLGKVGRFEPTSAVCSQCGVTDDPEPLSIRVWECGVCGAVLDRDIKAAVNIAKTAALAVSACRARIRPELFSAQRTENRNPPEPADAGRRNLDPSEPRGCQSNHTTDKHKLNPRPVGCTVLLAQF